MKIKVKEASYEEVLHKNVPARKKTKRPNMFWRTLMKVLSQGDLKKTHFECRKFGMDALKEGEPCLVLMNHSSFIDLEIAATLLYPKPFHIVCTSDGFVGKDWLLRQLGCISTQKFVTDMALVRDMKYAVDNLKDSILMYPEASYSFDGTATPLPDSLGKLLKMLAVPVVMIKTYGAFSRDPLYNNLQVRKVDVSADMIYLLSPEQIKEKSSEELNEILREQFTFDHFKWQQENHILIKEPFRADYLNRVLYQCVDCGIQGKMLGKGTKITCQACGAEYELTEEGFLLSSDGKVKRHIPDWYRWQREQVRHDVEEGNYRLDVPVDIYMLVDTECVYKVGEGRLEHSVEGFHLTGCDGALDYMQKATASYSLYSDYYWYEIGDMICIGTPKVLYYCFPKTKGDLVAKTRLAAEEIYKYQMGKKSGIKKKEA